ncbi:MAG TPA: phosphoribosylamine--glycine ligase [Actinomycetota bacterium]|nr:phosphoribosylamine--glycine ligase [Actinomycetota bacterium]
MRTLVVGGGGREHALAWALARSPSVDEVLAAPGNPGIAREAECIAVEATDVAAIPDLVERRGVDLTVIGPEAPLVAGLADVLRERGHRVFGPGADGARLEASKSWAKSLCERYGIPAGQSVAADTVEDALEVLDRSGPPYVVKADGLAAGKGVVIATDRADAEDAVRGAIERRDFGDAGSTLVIEEFLEGREVSAFAIADGSSAVPLAYAQDHKRIGDGDIGPNTGGMGAVSPVPAVDEVLADRIRADVLDRTVAGLREEGVRYVGVVYAGLMLTSDGPKVLEYNARFGDPETQVLLPRLRSDLGRLLAAAADGRLAAIDPPEMAGAAVTVVLASEGYPGRYDVGHPIEGLADAEREGAIVFHAGTRERDGRVVTAGGRVLSVTAVGDSIADARERAYAAASRISFRGMHLRRDIAARAAEEERA